MVVGMDSQLPPAGVRRPHRLDGGPYRCPCCQLVTLETSANFEICSECGWEDDGQDDHNADQVLGGPNGLQSLTQARDLTQAREEYAAFIAQGADADSVSRGGEGSWWAAAKRAIDEYPQ